MYMKLSKPICSSHLQNLNVCLGGRGNVGTLPMSDGRKIDIIWELTCEVSNMFGVLSVNRSVCTFSNWRHVNIMFCPLPHRYNIISIHIHEMYR